MSKKRSKVEKEEKWLQNEVSRNEVENSGHDRLSQELKDFPFLSVNIYNNIYKGQIILWNRFKHFSWLEANGGKKMVITMAITGMTGWLDNHGALVTWIFVQ